MRIASKILAPIVSKSPHFLEDEKIGYQEWHDRVCGKKPKRPALRCPNCNASMGRHGIPDDSAAVCKCPSCRKTWTALWDGEVIYCEGDTTKWSG
jgi:hypothetical protein